MPLFLIPESAATQGNALGKHKYVSTYLKIHICFKKPHSSNIINPNNQLFLIEIYNNYFNGTTCAIILSRN